MARSMKPPMCIILLASFYNISVQTSKLDSMLSMHYCTAVSTSKSAKVYCASEGIKEPCELKVPIDRSFLVQMLSSPYSVEHYYIFIGQVVIFGFCSF